MKKANNKIKNNEPQKTKDRATRIALKPGVNSKVTWRLFAHYVYMSGFYLYII
jgi:hypothetical protein